MKKAFVLIFSILFLTLVFGYAILFEGKFDVLAYKWSNWTRNSESLPFSPYKIRREDSAFLRFEEANRVVFQDNHLFWKGTGAKALAELTVSGKLVNLIVNDGGEGYSNQVMAYVVGANNHEFKLGEVKVSEGRVIDVAVLKASIWSHTPIAYFGNERKPFSGTIEQKFPSGQIIEETPYLSGKIHGKIVRYEERGIPIFSKEYDHGKREGTHIYWFPNPIDPVDYVPKVMQDGDLIPTLWLKIQNDAKEKFGKKFGNHESNKWAVDKYKLSGGSFQVKLLEHWLENRKHGLFEGFDEFGNKTFKDDYDRGLRIKHKTFDKTK